MALSSASSVCFLQDLILAMDHAEMENIEGLTECLSRIPDTVNTMKKTVAKMHRKLVHTGLLLEGD